MAAKWQRIPDFRYAPVRKCIYCLSPIYEPKSNRRLGDEHIIPEGLGGHLILQEASCKKCKTITTASELPIMRRVFGAFRLHVGLPSKRPKERPTTLPVTIMRTNKTLEVPAEMYPAMVGI